MDKYCVRCDDSGCYVYFMRQFNNQLITDVECCVFKVRQYILTVVPLGGVLRVGEIIIV